VVGAESPGGNRPHPISVLACSPKLVAILLAHQSRDGSWLSDDAHDRTGGRNDCTAMAVLALTVEYRYLPIYQR
jgi:hypothetical protein